jgi:hypothetical protein
MKLDAYLLSSGHDDETFGALIGRDRTTVYRLRIGKTKPDWNTVIAIREATGGRVSAEDWLEAIVAKKAEGEAA